MFEAIAGRNARTHPHGAKAARRGDYEYRRGGTANLFIVFAPRLRAGGIRKSPISEQPSTTPMLKKSPDKHFPKAEKIVLVRDSLNTHKPASLYEAFRQRKHDVWSNASNGITPSTEAGSTLAESELGSVLSESNASTAASPIRRPDLRNRRLGQTPKQTQRHCQLAVHHRRCPRQAQASISYFLVMTGHRSRLTLTSRHLGKNNVSSP